MEEEETRVLVVRFKKSLWPLEIFFSSGQKAEDG